MKLINLRDIIDKCEGKGGNPERTLRAIKKMINSERGISQIINEGLNEARQDEKMKVVQSEIDYFFENKERFLVDMVKEAFEIFVGKGKEEMIKYLDENYEIYKYSEREKKERDSVKFKK